MTVTQDQLAAIIAELTDGQPVTIRTQKPRCRATGCTERLDPVLVDLPDNSGLHLMCEEPAGPPAPAPVQLQLDPPTPAAEPPPTEPPSTVAELRDLLVDHDANSARSMQTALGPSEIGDPCQRSLAYRLTGTPKRPDTRVPWAPILGTSVHAYLADVLTAHNTQLGRDRWIVEERVYPDDEHPGSGDAYDRDTFTIIDWKLVGDNSLAKYRKAMRPEYRVQAHLYGLGHERAGRRVDWVRLVLLHRSHDYDKSWEWTERYDPEIALHALDRLYATTDLINNLGVADNPAMWGAIPATPSPECRYCKFFQPGKPADGNGCPGDPITHQRTVDRFTDGLIAK